MPVETICDMREIDPAWDLRSEEDKAAIRAGALSAPGRKMQCWGLPCHWREAGPFDWTGCDDVFVMVGRLSGVPTAGNQRFSADHLLQLHEWGMTPEEIVEDYALDIELVRRVLAFADRQKVTAQAA
jgi:uncharacterized protein (DUF433 family)